MSHSSHHQKSDIHPKWQGEYLKNDIVIEISVVFDVIFVGNTTDELTINVV
jgi:hypothetical protein